MATRGNQASDGVPPIKEYNNEDDIPFCSAIARVVTRDANYGSGANPQKCDSNPGIQDRGPRDRSSVLERRLHDRPRRQRVRRADVDLWKHRRTRTIQRRILTCSLFAPMMCEKEDMNQNRIQSIPTKPFLQFLVEIRTAGPSLLAAVAFDLSDFFVPEDCSRP